MNASSPSTALPNFPLIYLASASPRRHELLKQINVEHEILRLPEVDGEDEPRLDNEPAADYVKRTALEKAQRAMQYITEQELLKRPILSADTAVIYENLVLGKPQDEIDVAQTLSLLSGKQHEVHTAIVLAHHGEFYQDVCISKVYMRNITAREIAMYVASGQAQGKAGAYAIQGLASIFIEKIEGSYSGIMGLPLFETWRLLQQLLK
ncbi:MAG: Maf family protein [Pelistega sp.]|nr:Maf family protein [Pelistega sp.]